MNSDEEFYYTNSTSTQPQNISKLKHIAGIGSSPVVQYEGTGAYFLDKIEDGMWRLEVMPDAISIRDPFERASPKKEVVRIRVRPNIIKINLPGIQNTFSVPRGKYLIKKKGIDTLTELEEFPTSHSTDELFVVHHPFNEVTLNKTFTISATIAAIDTADKVSVELRPPTGRWRTLPMQRSNAYEYKSDVPVDMIKPGIISYRILIRKKNDDAYTFPGGFKGNPFAWDEYRNETWQTFVATDNGPLELFNPTTDRTKIILYNPDWRNNTIEYITSNKPKQLVLKATMNKPVTGQFLGWQYFFGDNISGRKSELSSFSKLVVKARSQQEMKAKITIITTDADAFAATISLTKDWKEVEIPLNSFQKDSFLLLPRPYPGFLPLRFKSSATKPFNISGGEMLEITFGESISSWTPVSIEVESVWLKK